MNRRKFITMNLAALGGVAIGQNITYAEAFDEIKNSYQNTSLAKEYDLVINGAGIMGCFTALKASKMGMRVLVTDKRTYPGFELTAKRKLWLKTKGCSGWSNALADLFIPEGEENEIFNRRLTGFKNSCIDDDLLLFAGSIKKGLLRSLLVNGVDLLLMTDIWGVLTDDSNIVSGVTIACKQGVFSIPCKYLIDATENNFFTRNLCNEDYSIQTAGFVLELDHADIDAKELQVDSVLGIADNLIHVHKGKKSSDQRFLSFKFSTKGLEEGLIEQKARDFAGLIGKELPAIHPQLSKAALRYHAQECSYYLSNPKVPSTKLRNFEYIDNGTVENWDCEQITDIINSADELVKNIKISEQAPKQQMLHFEGKRVPIKAPAAYAAIKEEGIELALTPFSIDDLKISTEKHTLLIAGGGTAGTAAALSASEQGCNPTIVEYFNDLGGTKTMGGVIRYYLGLNKHPYIVEQERRIKETASTHRMTGAVSRSYYHYKSLKEFDHQIIDGAIICGANVTENRLQGIVVCKNGKLKVLETTLVVDATADADVAYFAGEDFELGNMRMGITQNYSHWDVPFDNKKFPSQRINKDYGIINNTQITEMQRGLFLSHYESLYYDFYPMIGVRESRRPKGEYTLDIMDVLTQTNFKDTIANANSDFDPHYYGGSEFSRCAFLLPHSNQVTAHIPYRAIVPKKNDGLLLSGRGISQTHNALQFTRMSADVSILGYATGQIASEILRQKVKPKTFSVADLHKEWLKDGFITESKNKQGRAGIEEIVQKLSDNKTEYLPICCYQKKEEALPILNRFFNKTPSVLIAKALSWFGETSGHRLIREELSELFKQEQQVGHPEWYYEEYKPNNLYWRINQNIALLGMAPNRDNRQMIEQILCHTDGGGPVVKAQDVYNRNRVDLCLIPFYNRILNLCFYIERNPDTSFIKELDRLADDENINNFITTEYHAARWNAFGALLELSIASCAARCGSKKGFLKLASYLNDIHSDFRRFSHQELKDITDVDLGFDVQEWEKHIHSMGMKQKGVKPLMNKIEY